MEILQSNDPIVANYVARNEALLRRVARLEEALERIRHPLTTAEEAFDIAGQALND
jgi:hypothetical protein